jgi:glycosyltransferase involved in cell wall biosynthesis
MKIGFYYHIPIFKSGEMINIPSFLGVFIDSLAKYSEELVLVMHEASGNEIVNCDYTLKSHNVSWINLGFKTPAWHRAIFYKKILIDKLVGLKVEILVVRSPSPLAPYFVRFFPKEKIRYYMVGDYESGVELMNSKSIRDWAIKQYLKYNVRLFNKAVRKTNIVVNSSVLYRKYEKKSISCRIVNTTTLSNTDFYRRDDTCLGNTINILYTGRIDLQKGLLELLYATKLILELNYPIILNIVGWEDNQGNPNENFLKNKAKELKIQNRVIFHGKKSVGVELNNFYRMADIYVIPSYHEGFPRTIWEAMANSLPVIATNVGSIPDFLTDKKDSILIPSKDIMVIKNSILELIQDGNLRKQLILNGIHLATNQTLEILTPKLINSFKGNE